VSESLAIALLASITAVLTAIVAPLLVSTRRRIGRLERRNRLSWLYIRSLIDHAYRHQATPLPSPPEGWGDDDE
jgi:predicted MFS family arabinose efflux permease